jgi:hypothetical protein
LCIHTDPTARGEIFYSYGNSGLRLGQTRTSPKRGISTGTTSGGWSHGTYTVTPGIPGDSGSAFVDSTGNALGVLVTLSVTGQNNVTDLSHALAYARAKTGKDLRLALGLTPFRDPLV